MYWVDVLYAICILYFQGEKGDKGDTGAKGMKGHTGFKGDQVREIYLSLSFKPLLL